MAKILAFEINCADTVCKSKCSSAVRVQWIQLTFLGSRHPMKASGGLAPSSHCLSGSYGPSQKSNRKSGKSRSTFLFLLWEPGFLLSVQMLPLNITRTIIFIKSLQKLLLSNQVVNQISKPSIHDLMQLEKLVDLGKH